MRARGLGLAAGAIAVILLAAIAPGPMAALPQTRTISLYNIHTKETLTVEFKKNGKFVPEAMERINWLLRDWRKNEKTTMDPELIDLLWEVHTELGSHEPIHIISGYRSRGTNNMLRSTVGGQASQSRHILGKAADVHFPDVPVRRLRYAGLIREKGGVGYYPTSAIPFVHLDTGRVRAWPRLPRHELALLFPNGHTDHIPADGRPLTPTDVQAARSQHRDLAVEVAEVQNLRRVAHNPATQVALAKATNPPSAAQTRTRVAAMTPTAPVAKSSAWSATTSPPPPPKLVAQPTLVERPSRVARGPSNDDKLKLAQLAAMSSMPSLPLASAVTPASLSTDTAGNAKQSLTGSSPRPATDPIGQKLAALATDIPAQEPSRAAQGRFGWASGWSSAAASVSQSDWAVAPAFDEEHPEELSYRPFPLAPYMTETASADDPALARMEHPDVAKTLEMLDQAGELPPMRLRPGQQVAQLLWAQQFQGEAVPLAEVFDGKPAAPSGLNERTVRLSAR